MTTQPPSTVTTLPDIYQEWGVEDLDADAPGEWFITTFEAHAVEDYRCRNDARMWCRAVMVVPREDRPRKAWEEHRFSWVEVAVPDQWLRDPVTGEAIERCNRMNCGLELVRPGKVQCWCDSEVE